MADRRDSEYGRHSGRNDYADRNAGSRYSSKEDRSPEEYVSDDIRFSSGSRDREFNGGGDRSYGQMGEYRSRSSRLDDQFRPASQGDRWQNRSSGYGSSDYGYGTSSSRNRSSSDLGSRDTESYNDYSSRSNQGSDYDSTRGFYYGDESRASRMTTGSRFDRQQRGTSDYDSLGAMGTSSWQGSTYGTRDSSSRLNHLGKGPKGWKRSDERIREDVCERLERDHHVDATEIEVMVKDGVVTLSGKVEDRPSKRHAEDIIENMAGVKDVRNELSVDQSLFQQAKEMIMGKSDTEKTTSSKANKNVPH